MQEAILPRERALVKGARRFQPAASRRAMRTSSSSANMPVKSSRAAAIGSTGHVKGVVFQKADRRQAGRCCPAHAWHRASSPPPAAARSWQRAHAQHVHSSTGSSARGCRRARERLQAGHFALCQALTFCAVEHMPSSIGLCRVIAHAHSPRQNPSPKNTFCNTTRTCSQSCACGSKQTEKSPLSA